MLRALALSALSLVLAACQAQASVPAPASSAAIAAQESPSELPSELSSVSPSVSPSEPPSKPPSLAPSHIFPRGRVATRVVVSRLGIDLPVMLQTAKYGTFPLCDAAMYLPFLGQPGQGRATYIYAHARTGMFLPLLTSSQVNNGQGMIGDIVEVYTADSYLFKYRIADIDRHALDLSDAFATHTDKVFLQTSEGPHGTIPKLQVIANFVSVVSTDWTSAHPVPHPRLCA